LLWKKHILGGKMFRGLKIFLVLISILSIGFVVFNSSDVYAASKKKGKGGLSEEQLTQMSTELNTLTKKMYGASLFSPEDNEKLIGIKLSLDDAMLKSSSPEYAPLYYMAGNLYKKRGYKDESIECYQTIMENFPDTVFAPKARQELTKMGVKFEVSDETE